MSTKAFVTIQSGIQTIVNFDPTTVGTTDHHAGWDEIQSGETVVIVARKQMHVFGELLISGTGTLEIDGTLVMLGA